MSLKVPKPQAGLFKDGFKHLSGLEEAVLRNIEAVGELSEIVRTSFGPNGRNKLIINHLNRLFVTSDAATIIREIEVVHPAAKLLVGASQAQEAENGDGTNFVLIFAGALLKSAVNLLVMGLHPSEVILEYELAADKCREELETLQAMELPLPPSLSTLAKALSPSIASKQPGNEAFLSDLVAEASLAVMPKNPKDFSVDAVRVVKILGGSLSQSRVVRGMVFGREPDGIIKKGLKLKVAVYTCGLDISQTETKATVLLKNAEEMLDFTKGEEKQMENIFQEIADSGVKLIIAGSGIGDLALHYLNRQGIAVLKVLSKFDLRRLCRVCGATPLARVGAPTAEEAGHVDILETIEIGGDRVTVLRQEAEERTRTATIVLRGATANHLDDLERSIDDGVNTVRSLLRMDGWSLELELRRLSWRRGSESSERRRLGWLSGIRKFAEALEVVPRTLAENAGLDASEVISALYKAHSEGQSDVGVDIDGNANGTIGTIANSILDPLAPKSYAIKLAVDAAVSVLRVDSIIVAKQAGIAPPKQNPDWDQD